MLIISHQDVAPVQFTFWPAVHLVGPGGRTGRQDWSSGCEVVPLDSLRHTGGLLLRLPLVGPGPGEEILHLTGLAVGVDVVLARL